MSNYETQVVLSNAAQLALTIIKEVLGNETSTSINGQDLTHDVVLSMVETRLKAKLDPQGA